MTTSTGTYYDRLGRWSAAARLFGHGGGHEALTVHRALADPACGNRPTTTRLHDMLIDALDAHSSERPLTALDAGCGLGGTMIDLHQRLGGLYVGLTLSQHQATTGRRAVGERGLDEHIRFLVQSYDDPPPGPYDLVIAIESLAHAARPAGSVAALARVLAPSGRLVIVDDMPVENAPGGGTLEQGAIAEIERDLDTFKRGWQCPALWTAAQYRQTFARLGLTLIRDLDLSSSCRPRTLARIGWLERLNRTARGLVPSAAWRSLMDSHHAGLALERLYRRGAMSYRLLIARQG